MTIGKTIQDLIARNALFVVNHSGGKDSQAMTIYLRRHVPASQLLVIHADLPEVDWPGCIEHIMSTTDGLPLRVCTAVKTFFQMVEHRQMWPSPKKRQCTSDLKRGPIEKEIRHYLKAHPEHGGLVVSCMGMRAEESTGRAKLDTFKYSARNSKAGREWYDWLPIHDWSTGEVFFTIAFAGEKPHWAYAAGMGRLSCCFCIMASRSDLTTAAKLRPDLYERYCETEKRIDQTMMMPANGERVFLPDITGVIPRKEEQHGLCVADHQRSPGNRQRDFFEPG